MELSNYKTKYGFQKPPVREQLNTHMEMQSFSFLVCVEFDGQTTRQNGTITKEQKMEPIQKQPAKLMASFLKIINFKLMHTEKILISKAIVNISFLSGLQTALMLNCLSPVKMYRTASHPSNNDL